MSGRDAASDFTHGTKLGTTVMAISNRELEKYLSKMVFCRMRSTGFVENLEKLSKTIVLVSQGAFSDRDQILGFTEW